MIKKSLKLAVLSTVFALIAIYLCNFLIEKQTKNKLYSSVTEIPKRNVGLVLGTSKHLLNGRVNLYYKYRIRAAVSLYKSGKITFIIVSGDNSTEKYDEPTTFKNDLIKAGIPSDKIFLDFAGFRTLNSVVRVKEIFGQTDVIIISQKFHNERAIYLANHFGVKAIGFNAKDVSGKYGLKVQLREYLARVKVFVDILFNVQPKFLGKSIEVR
ncbi:vancomycin high temperature exclusion protein [Tenacibaculum finnmarkense]|uniref:SanA/YdcF family protein n=1 Tax=Tenacibaculum finnmarkense TaxID=2781243 RepID=UPI001EFAB30F|nr:ElyC/SanA/YdcF family protein [Tenacibaculum finnmarkense]MCG8894176.1 vancomycin high temperature exclusion protein [Tenacibaculum finnmarkense]MCG8902454.1 vancomycin high temperature exclusion protein [Tenacibaculum finnmarkense]